MNDQSPNSEFKASSFMQGHNAEYLEQLYAQYAHDPKALDETWQEFFKAMGDDEVSIKKDAAGPSWGRRDWPPTLNDDLTAALDGQWVQGEKTQQIIEKISHVAEEKNIEISNDIYGKPFIKLKGTTYKYLKKKIKNNKYNIHLSLSDDKPWAQATVIISYN